MMDQSIAAWRAKLIHKPLSWLMDQREQWNGLTYRLAVDELVKEKRYRGEDDGVAPRKKVRVLEPDDADNMVVEHIPYGGKGQTLRVEIPVAASEMSLM